MNLTGSSSSDKEQEQQKQQQSFIDLLGKQGKERRARSMALNLPGLRSSNSTSRSSSTKRSSSSKYKSKIDNPEYYINQIPIADNEVGTLRHRTSSSYNNKQNSCTTSSNKQKLYQILDRTTRDIRIQNISNKVSIIVLALCLIILIRFTSDDWNIKDHIPKLFYHSNKHTKQSLKSTLSDERFIKFKSLLLPLVYSNVDDDDVFRYTSSSQYKALEWLSKVDEYIIDIPEPPGKTAKTKTTTSSTTDEVKEIDASESDKDADANDDDNEHSSNDNTSDTATNEDSKVEVDKKGKDDNNNTDNNEETYYQIIQRYVLALLYFSTYDKNNKDSWNLNEQYNWLSPNKHVCEWNNEGGIRKCSNLSKHVLDISLSNNLIGTIPSEISKLTSLRMLYLSHNQLKGTIPSELSKLDKLNYLGLQYNKLTGTVPTELGLLKQLSYLGLEKNDIIGSVSHTHPICKFLRALDSDSNPTKLTSLMILTTDCRGIESTGTGGPDSSNQSRPPEIQCDCCTECYRY